jgi:filamentous hemagglutinin family protein
MSSEPGLRTFLSQRVAPATSRGGLAADGQRLRLTRISFAVAAAFSSVALGNPLNPTVVVGSATFQSTANTLTVTNTNGAVINWRGFSIGQGEITRFIQPGALSQVLNRVTGGSPSVILGALQSNGRVFLINQNGIAFGPGAQVDVGGLVVSSLGLSNADFAAGRLNFTQQAGAGGIVNQGVIRTASGGLVALVAPNVENHGVIQAPNGDVILAAGKSANLVDLQRPQIQVEVNAADNQALNVGQLVGRNIGIYAGAIRHAGIANANTAALDEQGRVVFKAVGDTLVSGKVEAGNTAGAGGRVEILGNRVGLLDGARVDASGVTGGGTDAGRRRFPGQEPGSAERAAYLCRADGDGQRRCAPQRRRRQGGGLGRRYDACLRQPLRPCRDAGRRWRTDRNLGQAVPRCRRSKNRRPGGAWRAGNLAARSDRYHRGGGRGECGLCRCRCLRRPRCRRRRRFQGFAD